MLSNLSRSELYKEAFRLLDIAEKILMQCAVQHSITQAQKVANEKAK